MEIVIGGLVYTTSAAVWELIAWGVVTVGMALAWGWLMLNSPDCSTSQNEDICGGSPQQQ